MKAIMSLLTAGCQIRRVSEVFCAETELHVSSSNTAFMQQRESKWFLMCLILVGQIGCAIAAL
jgi:hypothetical protein